MDKYNAVPIAHIRLCPLNQIETITLDYNSNGQLSKKVVSINNTDTTYQYYYDNGKLISMTAPQGRYYFYYDSIGVTGFILKSGINVYDIYICVRDSFNNIAYITDSSGNPLIKYDYDPWGNYTYQLLSSNPNVLNVVSHFPFKYRGYIYDEDLKLYYLKSRFYDSVSRSFISRDHYSYLDITSPTGINLYCYCGYNPIMYTDENGNMAISAVLLIGGFIIGAALGATASAITQGINKGWDNINGWQVLLDASIGGISGLIAFSGLGVFASATIGAGLGFIGSVGGDLISSNGDITSINWNKAANMAIVNFLIGMLAGPGVQNKDVLSKSLGKNLSNTSSYKAIVTALSRYGKDIGFTNTWNLYGQQLTANSLSLLP